MKRLEPRTYTKIFFEDNGQDFLYWIIDDQGRVVSAGPFQNEIWKDNMVDLDSLVSGKPLFFTSKFNGEDLELKHKVEKVVTGPLAKFDQRARAAVDENNSNNKTYPPAGGL